MADQNHPLRLYDWKERRKVSGENKDKALQINILQDYLSTLVKFHFRISYDFII